MTHRRLAPIAAAITFLVALAACGSSSSKSASPTTQNTRSGLPAYEGVGPYAVGYTTLHMTDRDVVVWYPAAPNAYVGKAKATYDQRSPLPANLKGLVPDKYNTVITMNAYTDAAASPKGPFPLVMLSHGAGGYSLVNSALGVGLASWGYVVTSTDYFERGLRASLPGSPKYARDPGRDTLHMLATIDVTKAATDDPKSVLHGLVDFDHIGAVGHSAGGGTAFNALQDPRVDVAVGWAPVAPSGTPANKPTMIIGARGDSALTPTVLAATYASFPSPKRYVTIEAGGHNSFSDVCPVIKSGGGLIQFAIANHLVNPKLAQLGFNGCNANDIDAAKFWPIVQHFTVAELRSVFGQDPTPVGLGAGITEAFAPVGITYLHSP